MFRILVVDDSPRDLRLTTDILRAAGYATDVASSSEDGIRMAGTWRYDLILKNMEMSDMIGGKAVEEIRSVEKATKTRRVPVIAFVGNADDESRRRAMRSGMDDFVVKPIEARSLLAAVERSLDDRWVVLLADDCTQDRERASYYLRPAGRISAITAATGAEAIAVCARQRVSFAFVNIELPDISGVEAAHQIRKSVNGANIGIIAVSNRTDPVARRHSIRSGCVGYLEKPFTRASLMEAIQPLIATEDKALEPYLALG